MDPNHSGCGVESNNTDGAMKNRRTFAILVVLCGALAAMAAAQHVRAKSIDGNWTVSFTIQGQTVTGAMAFQTEGEKLTGTVETQHTGPGKLEHGTWASNKLSASCIFEKHEEIDISGELKDG